MDLLPVELKIRILANLDANELTNICSVSEEYNNLCHDESLWKRLVIDKFEDVPKVMDSWYETYKYYIGKSRIYTLSIYADEPMIIGSYTTPSAVEAALLNDIIQYPTVFFIAGSRNRFMVDFMGRHSNIDRVLMLNFFSHPLRNHAGLSTHPQYRELLTAYLDEFPKYLNDVVVREGQSYIYEVNDDYQYRISPNTLHWK